MSSLADHLSLEQELVLDPINYKTIISYQPNHKSLIEIVNSNKDDLIKHFYGADKKYSLICRKHKILIFKELEKSIIMLYAIP